MTLDTHLPPILIFIQGFLRHSGDYPDRKSKQKHWTLTIPEANIYAIHTLKLTDM